MDQNDSKPDMGGRGSVDEPKLSPNAGFLERVFGITSTAGKIGCMSPLFAPLLLIGYCSYRSAESNRAAAQAEVVERAADDAAYQESVRTGKVCEDGPNGLGLRLDHSQNAKAVAMATPERKLAASLS